MTMNPFWAVIAVTAILTSQFPVALMTPLLVGGSRNSSQLSIDVKGAFEWPYYIRSQNSARLVHQSHELNRALSSLYIR
jgi:hypothetical protein